MAMRSASVVEVRMKINNASWVPNPFIEYSRRSANHSAFGVTKGVRMANQTYAETMFWLFAGHHEKHTKSSQKVAIISACLTLNHGFEVFSVSLLVLCADGSEMPWRSHTKQLNEERVVSA